MPKSQFHQGRKWVNSPEDLPQGEHYVILTFSTITIPGDERSRTHPGHGYPESTQHVVEYVVYETEEAWKAEIRRLSTDKYERDNWAPIFVRRAALKTTVTVEIG